MTPTLAAVVPNYNHARYLPASLGALLAQSVPLAEIVVVDDASTDDSVAVVEALAARHANLRLVRQPKNRGVAAALNRGLSEVAADYVTLPGADDMVLPGFAEKSLALLARHPRAGLSSGLCRLIGPAGEDLGLAETALPGPQPAYYPPAAVLESCARLGNWITTHTAVFRRAAVLEAGGYDESVGTSSDTLLLYGVAARHGACFLPEPLAAWRKLDDSAAQRHSLDVDHVLADLGRLEARMRGERLADVLPASWVDVWKRQALGTALYEFSRRDGADWPQAVRLATAMPAPRAAENALRAALERGGEAARLGLKAYLFAQLPAGQRLRVAARKLGLGAG